MKTYKRKIAGIYLLLDEYKTIVYVGQSHDIFKRLRAHTTKDWEYFEYEEINDAEERGTVEAKLIKEYSPKYNRDTRKYIMPEYHNRISRKFRWELLRKTEKKFNGLNSFSCRHLRFYLYSEYGVVVSHNTLNLDLRTKRYAL